MHDRVIKNRTHKHIGELNGRSKLNEDLVLLIREDLKTTSIAQVSRDYNMSKTLICNIKHRRNWTHI